MPLLGPLQYVALAGILVGDLLAGVAVVLNSPPILFVGLGVIVLGLLPATLNMALDRRRGSSGRAA